VTFASVANTLEVEFPFLMCGLREGRNNVHGVIQIDARLQEISRLQGQSPLARGRRDRILSICRLILSCSSS
jgi:hypothetical protein